MLAIEDTRAREGAVGLAGPADCGRWSSRREAELTSWTRAGASTPTNPFVLITAGLVLAAVAFLALVVPESAAPGESGTDNRPTVPAPAAPGIFVGGPQDVTVQMAAYEPGQSSGWHTHTGMHAVIVLSGTLTFYDSECKRRTYGAGDTYVGGREVHLATNETAARVEMSVTYVFPAGVSHTEFHVPSPAPVNCVVD